MSELKPCPFCGGEVKVSKISRYSQKHQVACYSQACAAQPSIVESKKSVAISVWNTRTPQSEWISVSDRLPSDDRTVSLLFSEGVFYGYGYGFYNSHEDDITVTYNPYKNTNIDYRLICWAELPTPPKQ